MMRKKKMIKEILMFFLLVGVFAGGGIAVGLLSAIRDGVSIADRINVSVLWFFGMDISLLIGYWFGSIYGKMEDVVMDEPVRNIDARA
ncbi:MAG: hypothetical protein ACTSRU_01855 [Candidatus Hodarchaeales archaeon]